MSKLIIESAELHNPLFLAGVNHQNKLPSNRIANGSMKLVYDTDEQVLVVHYNSKIAIVPNSNVASMVPVDSRFFESDEKKTEFLMEEATGKPKVQEDKPAPKVAAPKAKIKAQVETPMDHVQGGPGAGKIRD